MFKKFLSCFFGSLVAATGVISSAKADDFPPSPPMISKGARAIKTMSTLHQQRSATRRESLLQIAFEYGDSLFDEREFFSIKFPIMDVISELYGDISEDIDDKIISDISNNFLGHTKITLCYAHECAEPSMTFMAGTLQILHPTRYGLVSSRIPEAALVYEPEANRRIAILLLKIYLQRDPTGFSETLKNELESYKA